MERENHVRNQMLLGVYERGSKSWLSPSPLVHKVWGQKKGAGFGKLELC